MWSEKEGEIHQGGGGEKGRRQSLGVGWWRILSWSSEKEMICQQSSLTSSLARLEADMEEFYRVTTSGGRPRPGSVRRGDLVAALHSDLAWHRARVLQTLHISTVAIFPISYLSYVFLPLLALCLAVSLLLVRPFHRADRVKGQLVRGTIIV